MTSITSPTEPLGHPDRLAGCKTALHVALVSLIASAEKAGWHGGEVACALNILVKAHIGRREAGTGDGRRKIASDAWRRQVLRPLEPEGVHGPTEMHRSAVPAKRTALAAGRH